MVTCNRRWYAMVKEVACHGKGGEIAMVRSKIREDAMVTCNRR